MKIQKCYITNGDSNTVRKTVDRNNDKAVPPVSPNRQAPVNGQISTKTAIKGQRTQITEMKGKN